MKYGAIRTLALSGSAAEMGTTHGAAFAADIVAYAAQRMSIVTSGDWSDRAISADQMLTIADKMLPAHRAYSPELTDEMLAMAAAAAISPAEAIIVGGFTDFVDAVRGAVGDGPYEDTCTAIVVPAAAATGGAAMLAQTWDMHDTATEHVVMFDLRPDVGPAGLVFTTVGCVGQIGMNEAGIAVGINNLTARRGTYGVTWPFVVRRVLQQTDLDRAIDCILTAELAGAHNFLLVDRSGRGVNVEAMPQAKHVTEITTEPLVHTNHCLHAATTAHEATRPTALMDSSQRRLVRATELLAGNSPLTPEALMAITRDEEAVCQVSHEPYHIESCGAAVMRPASGDFWAVWGRPDRNDYEHFEMAAA